MRLLAITLAATAVLALGACGSSSSHASTSSSTTLMPGAGACTPVGDMNAADQTILVTLKEWSIDVGITDIARGVTHFSIANDGKEIHNFEVIKGSQSSMPKSPDGSLNEGALPKGAELGAVTVPPGSRCDVTVDLTPGPHTLACNLHETMGGTDMHIHYAKGMHAELDVST